MTQSVSLWTQCLEAPRFSDINPVDDIARGEVEGYIGQRAMIERDVEETQKYIARRTI